MDDDNEVIVVDAKPGDGPGFDPFSELDKEKKERVKKNKSQQLANLKNAAKVRVLAPHALLYSVI